MVLPVTPLTPFIGIGTTNVIKAVGSRSAATSAQVTSSFFILFSFFPSLPNTLWAGVCTPKHLLRMPLGGSNYLLTRYLEDFGRLGFDVCVGKLGIFIEVFLCFPPSESPVGPSNGFGWMNLYTMARGVFGSSNMAHIVQGLKILSAHVPIKRLIKGLFLFQNLWRNGGCFLFVGVDVQKNAITPPQN